MSIFVIGINHKTAPITVREKAYFAKEKLSVYLQDLLNQGYTQEAVLLSTCNRSEIYFEAKETTALCDWFCAQTQLSREDLASYLYIYQDEQAVSHLMAVACGLDSMILGEPQILGQLKEAFTESLSAGAVGSTFHQLFKHIFSIAKEVRTTTAIGACPVSVASAAVRFASQQCADFANARVLLIGVGDTTELLFRYLQPQLQNPMAFLNRSIEKAAAFASRQAGGQAFGLEQISEALAVSDVVFSATGSVLPLVTKEMVVQAMQTRTHRPLLFVDVAVPRDIDDQVAAIPNVTLHCIDDLKTMIEHNLRGREHAASKAHEMIRQHSQEFMLTYQSLDKAATTIKAYRSQIESICRAELLKAKQQLHEGKDPAAVMDAFAYTFTKKLLHTPSAQLRQAGAEGRLELLHLAKQLFAIQDPELEADCT